VHFSHPHDPPLVLHSLDPADVVPFLQRNLHWRVRRGGGAQVARTDVPGLKVWITDQMETLPSHMGELSTFEAGLTWRAVTHGRDGGMAEDEWWEESE
jgi:tyrosinase